MFVERKGVRGKAVLSHKLSSGGCVKLQSRDEGSKLLYYVIECLLTMTFQLDRAVYSLILPCLA